MPKRMSEETMKRRRFMKRSCFDKVRHNTREAAYDHIRRLAREREVKMKVYFCKVCHGFHVARAGK